ncbi:hypothetical protein NAL32_21415 [Chryseobacterium sp. Ch-15]|uniref:DUF6705 domain-containing protein n=1 Tax=Chryseobacterium muglaense TaxID=2893752 RepID=A0A9Q3UYM7_9FLAO|nr:DUF6705 family protein [Chryseobacterium muglaense]MBD3907053.1 hypothetical protein [Chryseobacterium muglaense]MCC9035714.1 hypothetical protein [Chryseobacterium muglaense]MCM2556953.1 hypothetical protein [Chryseobacterium muglaense]
MKNMLKIIPIFIVTLFMFNCKAQDSIPNPGDNILDNNINKFVGTWYWADNGNSFKIILKKENILFTSANIRADRLIGFHQFIQNNIIIEDATQYSNTNYTDKKSTILGAGVKNEANLISGSIRHLTKNKSVHFEIQYIDPTHIKLTELKNTPGIKVNLPGKPPYDRSISLPQDIILTKQ